MLSQKLPLFFEKYHDLFRRETKDEKLVYLSVRTLEDLLTQILLKHLLKDASVDGDALFDDGKPLGGFGAKILAAHRLGLISEGLAKELQTFRRIRKEFRNRLDCRDLDYKGAQELCKNFWAPVKMKNQRESLNGAFPNTSRGDFELTAAILGSLLENILDNAQETRNTPLH